MEANDQIIVNNLADLYRLLPEKFRDEYSIGIHGFAPSHYEKDNHSYDLKKIEKDKRDILDYGLKFDRSRILLSTVKFGDLSYYMYQQGRWTLGGIIVALPKVVENKSGKQVFIGSPHEHESPEDNLSWDRNREPTSLCEITLPEEGVLNPMFILGTYEKMDKESVMKVKINHNHISFNNGIVPDVEFDRICERIQQIKKNTIFNVAVQETQKQEKEYQESKRKKTSNISIKEFVKNAIRKGLTINDISFINAITRKIKGDITNEK